MPQMFKARLAAVRSTPSRADDVHTVTRIVLEAHDITVDELNSQLGEDLSIGWARAPLPATPLEEAIDEAANGHAEQLEVPVTAGSRRRGTRSSER